MRTITDPAASLLAMTPNQLDTLYRRSPAGNIPEGHTRGTALLAPGTALSAFGAWYTRTFAWQGKVFNAERGELLNCVTPFRLLAVRAKVYKGASRFDGGEAIIIDYSRTSLLARLVRDEIREVSPGLYLGFAYVGKLRVIAFALAIPYR
jgi:hypothetical protein